MDTTGFKEVDFETAQAKLNEGHVLYALWRHGEAFNIHIPEDGGEETVIYNYVESQRYLTRVLSEYSGRPHILPQYYFYIEEEVILG